MCVCVCVCVYVCVGASTPNLAKVGKLKMEFAIPLDRGDVYLSFSERIIHLPHVYPKLCLIELQI